MPEMIGTIVVVLLFNRILVGPNGKETFTETGGSTIVATSNGPFL
jgi:hypothetical protein